EAADGEATFDPFDHVVLGSRGRTGLSRIVLGSVAEGVVRRAEVPVTVVR
ncbi:universal stress protein, partial [Halorubrum sp. CBA1125]